MTSFVKYLILFGLICSGSPGAIYAQLYPGDINNNGIANAVDFLYLGVAYGSTGPERDNPDNDWSPQTLPDPWALNFSNGLNYSYADCTGDGVVDDDDIEEGVLENFGETHGILQSDGYSNGIQGMDPVLRLVPNTDLANAGSTVSFDIVLGSENMPISEFYALAFSMTYDVEFSEDDDNDIEAELVNNSWIDPTNGSLSRIMTVFEDNGHAEIGITRINQQAISNGFGVIATFSIVIEDDIASSVIDTFHIDIDSVLVIGPQDETISIAALDTFVLVTNDSLLGSSAPTLLSDELNIFPNPSRSYITFKRPVNLRKLCIYNIFGQTILTEHFPYQSPLETLNLKLPHSHNGMHYLHLETDEGILVKPFIIQQ